jgi:general secretion pathway protein D
MHCYKPVLIGLFTLFLLTCLPLPLVQSARLATEDKVTETTGTTTVAPGAAAGSGAATSGILLNFKDVDLRQIIDLMSDLTGTNFLVDEKVRGKVTIIAPRPVSLDEAYSVFLSILEVQGFTVVPQGPITKIIPSREVKESPLPTAITERDGAVMGRDEFITQLIPLEHADANDIRGLLSALVSKESSLLAYAPTNTLILTEVQSNINRLMKIIRALDVEAPAAVLKVIALKFAAADQMATSLQTALEGLAQTSDENGTGTQPARRPTRQRAVQQAGQGSTLSRSPTAPKIIADTRTNSLVVIATPEVLQAAENLIAKLDVPTPEGRGQIHVYYLAHANAEELAQVLTAQATEIERVRTASTGQQARTQQQQQQQQQQRTGGQTGTTPLGITITADKPTNALVITAPPEAYAVLKEIIEKLDIRRSQVLVEALFAEVTLGKAEALGVEWRVLDDPDSGGTQVFGSSIGSGQTGVINELSDPATALSASPAGLIIGALRNTITIGNNQLLNIPVVLRAFEGDTDVNILATPNLLTTDNEEAEIVIGEERPFLRTAQDTPSGAGTGGFSTTRNFEFRDVGITLRMTPQISHGKTVRLNLFVELTAFVDEAEVGAVTTTKRSTETTVIADDGQTIVIGGLIREDENKAQTQVPCLGNMPLLGWAFRQNSEANRKNNLLIFITPHILNTPGDIQTITEHKRLQSDRAPEISDQLRRNRPQENRELLLD